MANDPWGAMRRFEDAPAAKPSADLGTPISKTRQARSPRLRCLAAPGSAPRPGDVACVWHAGVHAKTVAGSLEAQGGVPGC